MNIEFLNFILTAGIVVNAILLFLTYKNPKQLLSRRILFYVFIFVFFICLDTYADLNSIDLLRVITFIPNELATWIVGPLLLIYLNAIFKEEETFSSDQKKHFIFPVIVLLGIIIPLLFYLLTDTFLLPHIKFLLGHPSIYILASNIFLIVYMLICLKLWSASKNKLGLYYSSDRAIDFKWIKYLLLGIIVVVFIDIATEIYELVIEELDWDAGYATVVALIFVFAYLGYYGINQSKILLPDFVWENGVVAPTEIIEKDESFEEKLINAMHQVKPYLNEDLTLGELAESIGTTDKKLSQLLNRQMNTSFYDFVNKFRIDHFIQLLQSEKLKTQTIFSLAQESGFKSKATFNRIFKKQFNCTPTQYLEKNPAKSK